jgi:hypothetical protein
MFLFINSIEGNLGRAVMLSKEGNATILKKSWLIPKPRIASVMAWITLTVHSSHEAVGLTAAFSSLSQEKISCNVVAAYYQVLFDKKDSSKTMEILNRFFRNLF